MGQAKKIPHHHWGGHNLWEFVKQRQHPLLHLMNIYWANTMCHRGLGFAVKSRSDQQFNLHTLSLRGPGDILLSGMTGNMWLFRLKTMGVGKIFPRSGYAVWEEKRARADVEASSLLNGQDLYQSSKGGGSEDCGVWKLRTRWNPKQRHGQSATRLPNPVIQNLLYQLWPRERKLFVLI
jgi:hypothetical protein